MTDNPHPALRPGPAHPRRRRLTWQIALAAVALLIVSAATAGATASVLAARQGSRAASVVDGVSIAGFPRGGANPGIFTDTCASTMRAANDPIMMPNMSGASMQHDFFGNLAPSASSTPAKLVSGRTSCSTSADASAYWTPVVYQNGRALTPSRALIYWRAPAATSHAVATMPAGISMIAGNEMATTPQNSRVIDWTCTKPGGSLQKEPRSDAPQPCEGGTQLRLIVTFPNCWDGHTLNGHSQQNVVYADAAGTCPTSHPVQIPQIVFHVAYSTSTSAGLTLSTGPATEGPTVTGHADFMNGWTQTAINRNVTACIDTQTRCGPTSGADATPRGGRAEPALAKRGKGA